MQRILAFRKQANKYTAMVLPPAAAGFFVFLLVHYLLKQAGTREVIAESYDFVPSWLPDVIILVILTAGAGWVIYYIYYIARDCPGISNAATVAGLLLTMALTLWPAQQCSLTGGMTAGATFAGGIAVTAALIGGKISWNLPDVGENAANIGKMRFVQIAVAVYMSSIALIAISSPITDAIPSESRGIILVFAGTGFVAASVMSPRRRLEDYLAIAGAVVSSIGAYIQMDQALAASDNANFRAVHFMIATGILACVPLAVMAGLTSKFVRIIGIALWAACIVMVVVFISALTPIFLIALECNAMGVWVAHGVGITSIATFSTGIATFIIVALILTFSQRKAGKETTIANESR